MGPEGCVAAAEPVGEFPEGGNSDHVDWARAGAAAGEQLTARGLVPADQHTYPRRPSHTASTPAGASLFP